MKALIASLTELGLIAAPALAQTNTTAPAHATKPAAKEAKAEGESMKTEAKEHKAAAHHHAKCSCPSKYAHKSHKSAHKAAKKSTTDTSTKSSS